LTRQVEEPSVPESWNLSKKIIPANALTHRDFGWRTKINPTLDLIQARLSP
jgi:hypothetical protein